jgi:membrane protein YqaA with SNARE-associated domain
MGTWAATILAFVFQESASMTAVLAHAQQTGLNLWLIHLLFLITTTFDIIVGQHLGQWLWRHFRGTRVERWIQRRSSMMNQSGRWYLLLAAGVVNFPYVNALIAAWFDLPFWSMFSAIFIGDLIFYILLYTLVLGFSHLSINIYLITALVAGITLASMFLFKKYFFHET